MDYMTLLSGHLISVNPLSLVILGWLWKLEQKLAAVVISAARREGMLDHVHEVVCDIKDSLKQEQK